MYLSFRPIFVIGVRISNVKSHYFQSKYLGRKFSYTPHNPSDGEIWQHIQKLDQTGMELIEKLNLTDFHGYLRSTNNTICGRYPISLLLAVSRFKKCISSYIILFSLYIDRQSNRHQKS